MKKEKQMLTRGLSVVLAFLIGLGSMPGSVLAAGQDSCAEISIAQEAVALDAADEKKMQAGEPIILENNEGEDVSLGKPVHFTNSPKASPEDAGDEKNGRMLVDEGKIPENRDDAEGEASEGEEMASIEEDSFADAKELALNVPLALEVDEYEGNTCKFTPAQTEMYRLKTLESMARFQVYDEEFRRIVVSYGIYSPDAESGYSYLDQMLEGGKTYYFYLDYLEEGAKAEISICHDYVKGVCTCCGVENIVFSGNLASGEDIALASSFLSVNNVYTFQMFPNEEAGGIYFLQGSKLKFLDLSTGIGMDVTEMERDEKVYVQGNVFYALKGTRVRRINLDTGEELPSYTIDADWGDFVGTVAFGVDPKGRHYVATCSELESQDGNEIESHYVIHLLAADGTELSAIDLGDQPIYAFDGFADNGDFYFEGYYNWIYWGYDHPGPALYKGSVDGNLIGVVECRNSVVISGLLYYDLGCIEYLCQDCYCKHHRGSAIFGNRYLVTVSSAFARMQVIDTKTQKIIRELNRPDDMRDEDGDYGYYDKGSVGTRAAYHAGHDSLILYDDSLKLVEYDLGSREKLASFQPAHPLFELAQVGNQLYLLEKENGRFFLERVEWKEPRQVVLSGEARMRAGTSQKLSMDLGVPYSMACDWSTSDAGVATVTSEGKVVAWKPGKVIITASLGKGVLKGSFEIVVDEGAVVLPKENVRSVSGKVTDNASANDYDIYGNVVRSYLVENDDGSLTRVESLGGKDVLVEAWEQDGGLRDSTTVKAELGIFGGFYSGSKYNFLVFGQSNPKESDETEVVRIVRYEKDWTGRKILSVKGANTRTPFDAGSLRMKETGDKLYIHTCHEMYADEDGINHQANMTFVVREEDMTMADQYYDVMNIGQAGYVSHSFNQFVETDGTYVYRVDHGDDEPRAASITRCDVEGSIENVRYNYAFYAPGWGNATGFSVGGLVVTSDRVVVAGNSVDIEDEDNYSPYGQRNIVVSVLDRDLNRICKRQVTNYGEDANVDVRNPHLVTLGGPHLLLLWEEKNSQTGKTVVKAARMDEEGNISGNIAVYGARLSDCAPVRLESGLVAWYVSNGQNLLYAINPYNLEGNNLQIPKTKISAATVTVKDVSYTGKARKPAPTVKLNGCVLQAGTDYTVSYKNNVDVGKAEVIVTGKGDYAGSIRKYFYIIPKANKVTCSNKTLTTRSTKQTLKLGATATGGTLRYSLASAGSAKVSAQGVVSIPANFVGILYVDIFAEGKNYTTASKRVTITVRPLAVKIRKVLNKAPRTLAFLWSKNGSVDGYQVQYSTTSKFTKSKKVLLKGSSVTKYSITGLTKGKTYYVRVRAYKTVNGTKIPSAWSTAVSAKIEK